jgi:hypothetical protein
MNERTDSRQLLLGGWVLAAALTAAIALTAAGLQRFEIVGPTVPFAYPWRLVDPTTLGRLTAWVGYALHNIGAWVIIYLSRRQQPRYAGHLRWYNWAMLTLHGIFIILHWGQSQLLYDGLAQDVPEITALGSVALMLMVVLILESPRRGLFFGRKVKFQKQFLSVVREYHGYFFTWAIIYTFWYHPAEATLGHLAGFFYMFLLLWQSVLLFNRAHLNKWWTLALEVLVLPHGVLVALNQGSGLWPMFGFGFGAVFVLTQMHGLGWAKSTKRFVVVGFAVAVVAAYLVTGRLAQMHEVTRIPVLEYGVVALLYLLFLAGNGAVGLARRLRGRAFPVEVRSIEGRD